MTVLGIAIKAVLPHKAICLWNRQSAVTLYHEKAWRPIRTMDSTITFHQQEETTKGWKEVGLTQIFHWCKSLLCRNGLSGSVHAEEVINDWGVYAIPVLAAPPSDRWTGIADGIKSHCFTHETTAEHSSVYFRSWVCRSPCQAAPQEGST